MNKTTLNKIKSIRRQNGFTLIELLIVIAIIAILTAIAIPSYQSYINYAKFSEVIIATAPYKTAAEVAVQVKGVNDKGDLNAGAYGIPTSQADAPGDYVGTVNIVNGVILASGVGFSQSAEPTYTLTADIVDGNIKWRKGGTCIGAKLC